eukprot:TRINITY_DN436_c0_g2_i1.p1 TRINITY_DN436_c0_g2~~TRINITY_DN436_c0_g2_i1.p1  ORF type:complete len:450 (+),score=140.24 TRINITY_DN436_c0_g2_i1:79-1428(+)
MMDDTPPEEFLCPITRDLMIHPVMDKEGHSFESMAILTWLLTKDVCPMGREKISASELCPNRALRSLIEKYNTAHGETPNDADDRQLVEQETQLKAEVEQIEEMRRKGIAPPPRGPPPPSAFRGTKQSVRMPAPTRIEPRPSNPPPPRSTLAASPSPPSTGTIRCQAIYRYDAEKPDELSIDVGDIINIVSQDMQWWKGNCRGRQGYFPSNFVKVIETPAVKRTQPAAPLIIPNASRGQPLRSQPKSTSFDSAGISSPSREVTRPTSLPSSPRSTSTSTSQSSQTSPAKISIPGAKSIFPPPNATRGPATSSLVKKISTSTSTSTSSLNSTNPFLFLVRTLFQFEAQTEKDLSFQPGDIIRVLKTDSKDGKGWWQGELRGKMGIFPSNFVQKCETVAMKILYNFEGSGDGELPLTAGGHVNVVDRSGSSGWWLGEFMGKTGFFPSNFVT